MKKFLIVLSALFIGAMAVSADDWNNGWGSSSKNNAGNQSNSSWSNSGNGGWGQTGNNGGGWVDQVDAKKNKFTIGPKLGLTSSSMTQPAEAALAKGAGMSFSGGLAANLRLGSYGNSAAGTGFVGINLELKYMLNSVKTYGTDQDGNENANFNVGYFQVPVGVQVYPCASIASMNGLSVEAGLSFAMLISRSPKSLTVTPYDPFASSVVYNFDTDNSKLKGGAINPYLGLGYTIPSTGLDINARYYIGVNKLAKNFNSKISTFELSVAWMFKVSEF